MSHRVQRAADAAASQIASFDTSLHTREGVRQDLGEAKQSAPAAEPSVERGKVARRAALLFALCLAVLQYYFMSVGEEILSLQSTTVFITPRIQGPV